MPFVTGVELVIVLVRLTLVLTVAVNDIHGERVVLNRGHDFDIQLIPLCWSEVRTIPVGKERRNSALLIGSLHPGYELAVCELFDGGNGSTAEGGRLCDSNHCYDCACKLH